MRSTISNDDGDSLVISDLELDFPVYAVVYESCVLIVRKNNLMINANLVIKQAGRYSERHEDRLFQDNKHLWRTIIKSTQWGWQRGSWVTFEHGLEVCSLLNCQTLRGLLEEWKRTLDDDAGKGRDDNVEEMTNPIGEVTNDTVEE